MMDRDYWHVRKGDFYIGIILFIINIFYAVFTLNNSNLDNPYALVLTVLFIIIQGIALLGILTDPCGLNFSLNNMHWIFVLIQFFYAAIAQISTNKFPWKTIFTELELVKTTSIILLWCVVYFITSMIKRGPISDWITVEDRSKLNDLKIKDYKIIQIMFLASTAIFVYSVLRYGGSLLSTRDSYSSALTNSGQIYFLVFNTTFRAFVLSTLCISLWCDDKEYPRLKLYRLLLLLYVVVLYFPTNSGRLWIMVVYMGLVLTIKYKFKNKFTMYFIVLVGIVFFASIIEVFRYAVTNPAGVISAVIKEFDLSARFSNGDFDCYTMIGRTIRYISENSITWGKQFLSAILFFVPRAIWSGKSVGSGAFVIGAQGADFTNVSSPMPAEGLINFGIFGVIILSWLVSRVCVYIDYNACSFRSKQNILVRNSFAWNIQYIYCPLVGYFYILLRGDLLSTFSNLIGFIMPIIILTICQKFRFSGK